MKSRFTRILMPAVAALFVVAVMTGAMEQFDRFQQRNHLNDGAIGGLASMSLQGNAYAQALPSQPLGGSPITGKQPCSFLIQASAGVASTAAACAAQYHSFGCAAQIATTPVPGNACNAFSTSIATVTGSPAATATGPGIQANYATANANPTTAVWGIQ